MFGGSITLRYCDDDENGIWVTSEDNPVGTESHFKEITDPKEQMMIALAEFLGYEPVELLNFDYCIKKKEW